MHQGRQEPLSLLLISNVDKPFPTVCFLSVTWHPQEDEVFSQETIPEKKKKTKQPDKLNSHVYVFFTRGCSVCQDGIHNHGACISEYEEKKHDLITHGKHFRMIGDSVRDRGGSKWAVTLNDAGILF